MKWAEISVEIVLVAKKPSRNTFPTNLFTPIFNGKKDFI